MKKLIKWVGLSVVGLVVFLALFIYLDPKIAVWRADRATEDFVNNLNSEINGIDDEKKIDDIFIKIFDRDGRFTMWVSADCGVYPAGIGKVLNFSENINVFYPVEYHFSIINKILHKIADENAASYSYICSYINGSKYVYQEKNKFIVLDNLQPGEKWSSEETEWSPK